MLRRSFAGFVMLALLIFAEPSAVGALEYTFGTIDVPGAVYTSAFGIDDTDRVVGGFSSSSFSGFTQHGFLTDGTAFTQIDYPGSPGTVLVSININSQIVGARCCVPNERGFLYDGTTFTDIIVPNTLNNNAGGLNTSGQIVGAANYASTTRGYLTVDRGATFTQFDFPGSNDTDPGGINDVGQIAGYFIDGAGVPHGFLKNGATFTQIDVPGSNSTFAFGINIFGHIVGRFTTTAGGPFHGFVTDGVTFTQLDVPGALTTEAFGINSAGKIVGRYTDRGGHVHGFLAELTSNTPGKVTGGGYIQPDGTMTPATLLIRSGVNAGVGDKATFGFVVKFSAGDANPAGNLQYNDHAANVTIKALSFTLLNIGDGVCGPNTHATIQGSATVTGPSGASTQRFDVEVDDCGAPSSTAPDTFKITTSGQTDYMAAGPVIAGNITIRKQ